MIPAKKLRQRGGGGRLAFNELLNSALAGAAFFD